MRKCFFPGKFATAPLKKEMMLDDLTLLQQRLIQASSLQEKNDLLGQFPAVDRLLRTPSVLSRFLQEAPLETSYVLKQLVAIGQGLNVGEESLEKWRSLAKISQEIDRFYREIGGIVGYQVFVLQMLQKKESKEAAERFYSPIFQDISEPTDQVLEMVQKGLEALPMVAELYPLGGAADRLHLVDEETGLELPAAKLAFAGRTLLEILLRDLLAREWLYYCLYGKQITVPVAIMTSYEKDNHRHVLQICEQSGWFGRPKESFRFFIQPLVPAVDEKGNWYTTGSCRPFLKPGGHGAIWKLARDEGVFDWFETLGCKKGLVRQINNPIAGLDYGLLAFIGVGVSQDMSFGFASCCRRVGSAEGIVVLKEENQRIVLTNIEYCDFLKKGIQDEPVSEGSSYSRFTSNTNILFADLAAVRKAVSSHPFPGLLMNLKPAQLTSESGEEKQVILARLESTMQNIADAFDEEKRGDCLETNITYVTYNRRQKTISVAKKAYVPGKSLLETPECCFYEQLLASRELLSECGFSLPANCSLEEYMEKGPDCVFLYHPALGPFYSIIQQKLRGGKLNRGAELILEIAEIDSMNLKVDGSFRVIAKQPLGSVEQGHLRYSPFVGKCILRNVEVQNLGVDWDNSAPFWKMDLQRRESLEVVLEGNSLFDAENVTFTGSQKFIVEDGMRMTIRQQSGKLRILQEPLGEFSLWNYVWEKGIKLDRSGKECAAPDLRALLGSSRVS